VQRSVLAQVSAAVFGDGSAGFFYLQVMAAGILILAANTAYNGFPLLGSILAQDRFLPRQLHTRGDRLVYSNGILLLAVFAGLLIVVFEASVTRLIQLYIIGVFTSFTFGQAGMVRHWNRPAGARDRHGGAPQRRAAQPRHQRRRGRAHRARARHRHDHEVHARRLARAHRHAVLYVLMRRSTPTTSAWPRSSSPTTRSCRCRAATTPSCWCRRCTTRRCAPWRTPGRPVRHDLTALTVAVDPEEARALQEQWERRELPVPLTVIASPYREITRPVLEYVHDVRRSSPRDVVTVFIPEYVVGHWWEQLLHNQSALRLKTRLLFQPGVMVTSVAYQLRSSERRKDDDTGGAAPGDVRRPTESAR
jgi:hypothetical protein